MNKIEVYNNWDPLEEIWLGDVWPAHFYDDLKSDVRDAFYKITEWTKEDLKVIENKFKEFNVTVLRPTVDKDKNLFIDPVTKRLLKPPICPRDNNAVIGNRLFVNPHPVNSYKDLISLYDQSSVNYFKSGYEISGANIVKLGRDILFDNPWKNEDKKSRKDRIFKNFQMFENEYLCDLKNDFRIHFSMNGGHVDGCFMPVRPGLLLATSHFDDYDFVFPKWEKLIISEPTYLREKTVFLPNNGSAMNLNPGHMHRWVVPNLCNKPYFNGYVNKFCKEWIGNYKETYFEVNIIMLDENNMMCIDTSGAHEPLFELFYKKGINLHIMPWRTRGFWDGGLHCITLDTKRKTNKQDYFPQRGENGLCSIIDKSFDNKLKHFFEEYNQWRKVN